METGDIMKTINDFLDSAKEITGSDYKTAQTLDLSRQAISVMRIRSTMSNENAVLLSSLVGCDPMEIIAACEISKHPDKAEFWGKWIAATVILSVGVMSIEPINTDVFASIAFAPLYIMRTFELWDLCTLVSFLVLLRFVVTEGPAYETHR